MTSSIGLNFFHLSGRMVNRFKLAFQEIIQDINADYYHYNLPDELFKFNKDKATLSLTLFDPTNEYEFLFNVYKGENEAYIQLDYLFRTVFELIMYGNKTYDISICKKKIEKLDSLGNKYRKRLTLINTDNSIVINNKSIRLSEIAHSNYDNMQSLTEFYQISAIFGNENNGGKNQFIVKKISKIDDEVNLEILKKKAQFSDFLSDMEDAIKNKNFFISIHNFKTKYNDIFKIGIPKLNKDNDYINYLCENNNIIDLEPFYVSYLANIILKNEKLLNNQQLLQLITGRIKKDFENIHKKNSINSDEKIRIMSVYFCLYKDCDDISHFNSLKIKNYIFSERQDNSIMDKVYKFYFKFIELLTEDSKIFFYLLQLDSGIGFFHKEKVYTFDLANINMVKKHLISLFPQSLTIYNFYKSKEHYGKAFCEPKTSGIALNEIFLLPNNKYNINIDYNSNNNKNITEDESDDIAMNIILYTFHEFMGHKKFHNSEEGTESPKKIVKNNKLIKLKNESEFNKNDKNSEFILISSFKKGDSGHFLEICYDKYKNQTIFKLLISLDNKGKLIYMPDLFTKNDEVLKKYVILRIIAKEEGIVFNFDKNMSIDEEINLMCQKIDYEKYIKEQNDKGEDKHKKIKNFHNKSSKKFGKRNDKDYFISFEKSKKSTELSPENKGEMNSDLEEQCSEEKEDDDKEEGEEEEEEEGEEEEEEEEEKEKNEGYRRLKRILKKFNLKNDEELLFNIEKIMNQTDLSEEDQKDLDYLYLKLSIIY